MRQKDYQAPHLSDNGRAVKKRSLFGTDERSHHPHGGPSQGAQLHIHAGGLADSFGPIQQPVVPAGTDGARPAGWAGRTEVVTAQLVERVLGWEDSGGGAVDRLEDEGTGLYFERSLPRVGKVPAA